MYSKQLYKEERRVQSLGWHPIPRIQERPDDYAIFSFESLGVYCGTRATDDVIAKDLLQALQQIDQAPLFLTTNRNGC